MAPPPRRRPRPGGVTPKRSSGSSENKGLGKVDSILQRQAEKRALGRVQWCKVSDDDQEPTIVRVWDPSLFREGYIHQVEIEVKVEGKRKPVTRRYDRMCLDQDEEGEPCPGCRDELERRYKFWLPVIERDAAIVNDAGKIIEYKDRVALLSGGTRLATVLNRIQKKKGLANQEIELSKSGEGFNVQYVGEALDKSPLSADDKALFKDYEAEKILDRYTKVWDYDHYYDPPGRDDDNEDDDDEDVGERSRRRGSSFGPRPGRGRAASQRDEDDDDDDEPQPRRRRSNRSQAGGRKPGRLSGLGNNSGDEEEPRRASKRRPPRRR